MVVGGGDLTEGDVGGGAVLHGAQVDGEEVLGHDVAAHHLVEGTREEAELGHRNDGVGETEDSVEDRGTPLGDWTGLGVDATKVGVGQGDTRDGDGVHGELSVDGAGAVRQDQLATLPAGALVGKSGGALVLVELLDTTAGAGGEVGAGAVGDPEVAAASIHNAAEVLVRGTHGHVADVGAVEHGVGHLLDGSLGHGLL
eukprot:303831_1